MKIWSKKNSNSIIWTYIRLFQLLLVWLNVSEYMYEKWQFWFIMRYPAQHVFQDTISSDSIRGRGTALVFFSFPPTEKESERKKEMEMNFV